MKAKINFSNGEFLTVHEDDIFNTLIKDTEDTVKHYKSYGAYRSKNGNLIQAIMDMVIQEKFFIISSNPDKVYNSKMIVSIESEQS